MTRAWACTPAEKGAKDTQQDLSAAPTQIHAHINIHTHVPKRWSSRAEPRTHEDRVAQCGCVCVCVSVVLSCKTYNFGTKLQKLFALSGVSPPGRCNHWLTRVDRKFILFYFIFNDTISDLLDQQLVRPNGKSPSKISPIIHTVKWPGSWVA